MNIDRDDALDALEAEISRLSGMDTKLYAAEAIKRFDYRKYARAKEFTLEQWYDALSHRTRRPYSMLNDWTTKYLPIHLEYLAKTPTRDLNKVGEATIYERTVEDMSLAEAWEARDLISEMPDELAACNQWHAEMTTPSGPVGVDRDDPEFWDKVFEFTRSESERTAVFEDIVFGGYNAALAKYGMNTGSAYARINLAAPDSVIVEHFSAWLSEKRAQLTQLDQCQSDTFTETDFKRWAQHRVLAYLDLKYFAEIAGVRLTQHAMGRLIFPDFAEVDVTEKIRKTTAPMAEALIGSDAITALAQMVNAERLRESERKA